VLLFLGYLLREHGACSLRSTVLPAVWSSWRKDVGSDYEIWPGCVHWKTRRPRWVLQSDPDVGVWHLARNIQSLVSARGPWGK